MEAGSEGEKKKPPEGEKENKTKRKMKTASQLETLEKTYAEEPYPSEAKRAELSMQLGLTDRQLQMWFCHRRLKDRKAPPGAKKPPQNDSAPKTMLSTAVASEGAEAMIISDARYEREPLSGVMPFGHLDSRRVVPRAGMGYSGGFPAMQGYYEQHQSLAELRAIAFVEAQLGEPLREDGPVLGMEFDPLPPDAFGAPIGVTTMEQHRQPGRPFEAKIYERLDKGVSRILHEYQFIPEQPTVRNETHEKVTPPSHYSSLDGVPHSRSSLIFNGRAFFNGSNTAPSGYGYQGQIPRLNILSQQGRHNHVLPSASTENDVPRTNTFIDAAVSTHIGAHPITQIDNSLLSSDRRVDQEDELSRFQRKRKNEEARMQRELEAQEKRIRKELEKQDILRQKREEQIRKEMERRDRERRKEEEKLMRERQREEERNQREQRRELERREKFLLKESIRAEKLRQKEELRREKEAARIKAANERAIARKMAKESIELIEDERLELVELAASRKGLSSILTLDYETLQNLDSYRDGQTSFPPKHVRLKRPFSFQPWLDSEENIGNLLMAWRFLITFADVLGIWPFTLDEFMQAFHDYDPRLLGEIHIALLRSIIKDIEDVARTPSTGAGANQNGAAIPSGGHPQVVEGAYVWGFDIRNWQRHLNSLTWPEILRQFALSAGFGPQLKKSNIEQIYPSDKNEGIGGEDIISNLRSGAAVRNAVAVMRERGLSNPRRSRHRLTPGTVKFAAFHVLSIEGSRGLNILEVADRIQKSGLRDLTTSKTPEASISAALSRDTKLFERTAPSTYCVRPAYRKDPADAEAILSAARERVKTFKSGTLDAEEPDEGARDEDSESDLAEEPEVDDLGTETNTRKYASNFVEFSANTLVIGRKDSVENLQTTDGSYGKVNESLASILAKGFNSVKDISTSVDGEIAGRSHDVIHINLEDMNIDESHAGEPWVQGLTEGEYSDLSVEERLTALVALIDVAIEGNSIRVVLEERLEAANALKKQLWAEAQLDKRRIKEDYFVKMQSVPLMLNKNEPTITIPAVDGKQSPLPTVEEKSDKAVLSTLVQQEQLNEEQINQYHLQSFPSEANLQMPEYSAGPDHYMSQHYSAESSRSNLKSYIGHLAEETYMYRFLPLGLDRRHNRYWHFVTSSQNDPSCGRVFVELHDGHWRLVDSEEGFDALLASLDVRGIRESHLHMMLKRIEMSFKESVGRNILNSNLRIPNGDTIKTEAVEMATGQDFSVNIHTPTSSVCISDLDLSETSTSFVVQLGRNEADQKVAFRRYQDFEIWMQKECLNCSILCAMKFGKKRCSQFLGICGYCHDVYYSKEIRCPSCHRTFQSYKSNSSSSQHMAQSEVKMANDFHVLPSSPLRMRLLKVLFSIVEVSIPQEALQPHWTDSYRQSWNTKLLASSSTEDLLQMFTVLEGAIRREYFASNFETTSELLGAAYSFGCHANYSIDTEKIPVLPWLPQTTAAVALRLMELDGSIFYTSQLKLESEKDRRNGDVVKPPSKSTSLKTSQDAGATETTLQAEHTTQNWVDLGAGLASYHRGQRTSGRGRVTSRGGKSQARVTVSRSESRRRVTTSSSRRMGRVQGYKGKPQGGGGRRRGQSTRRKQKPDTKVHEITHERDSTENIIMEDSTGIFVEEITGAETSGLEMEAASNGSSSQKSDYEEDNQATGEEYDDYLVDNNDDDHVSGFSRKSENNTVEGSDYNVDDEDDDDIDDNDDGSGGNEDRQVDLDAEDYTNGDSDIEENIGDAEQNMGVDGGESTSSSSSSSSSSEYSD